MAKLQRVVGSTSQRYLVFIQDSSLATGAGLTGLAYNTSGLTCYYKRNTATASTAVTLANITTLGTFVSGGFKEVDATNMPGVYEFHPPNAAFATAANSVLFQLRGAANMTPVLLEIELTATNNQDAAAGGMSRIDVTLSSVKTGVSLASTQAFNNTGQTDNLPADVKKVLGTTPTLVTDDVPTATEISTQVASDLATAHGAGSWLSADVSGLSTFDPATDTVAHVTLVDTCTTNTDMRGTDSAYTGTPPTAGEISTQVTSDLATAHGSGSWATATGFSTLDAAGVRTAVGLASADIDTQLGGLKTTLDKLDSTVELDGAGPAYQFTAAALDQAPTGGGVGTADWTATEKAQIRYRIGIDGTESAPVTNTDVNLPVVLAASQTFDNAGQTTNLPANVKKVNGVDVSVSGSAPDVNVVTIAGQTATATSAVNFNALSTYDGQDTSGVTTLVSLITTARAAALDNLDLPVSSCLQPTTAGRKLDVDTNGRVDVGAYAGVPVDNKFADFQGALTAATATTLSLKSGVTFGLNQLAGRYVEVLGTNSDQVAIVTASTADDPPVLTLDRTLATVPTVGDSYLIGGPADVRLTAGGFNAVAIDVEQDGGSTANDATAVAVLRRLYRRFFRPAEKSATAVKLKSNAGSVVSTQPITDDGAGNETQGAAS